MSNLQKAKAFRPADPREYDHAQAQLSERGHTIGDFIHASLRWFNRDPQNALDILAPDWPPPRVTGRRALVTAFAVQDVDGTWLNEASLGLADTFQDCRLAYPFKPADPFNPLAGQQLTLRCGEVTDEALISPYAVRVLVDGDREIAVRISHDVQDVLFGPAILGTPEWLRWEARREQRRAEIEDGVRYRDLVTAREIVSMPMGGRRAVLGRVHAFNPESGRILCGWTDGDYQPGPDTPWAGLPADERCPECRVIATNLRSAGR